MNQWDRDYRRCRCPIHVEGTLRIDGFIRKGTKETVWEKAEELKRFWEERGTVTAPLPDPIRDPADGQTVIATAKSEFELHYIGYIGANRLPDGTARKYGTILGQLAKFCTTSGIRFVSELKLAELQHFQATWTTGPRAGAKKLENLRCFMQWPSGGFKMLHRRCCLHDIIQLVRSLGAPLRHRADSPAPPPSPSLHWRLYDSVLPRFRAGTFMQPARLIVGPPSAFRCAPEACPPSSYVARGRNQSDIGIARKFKEKLPH